MEDNKNLFLFIFILTVSILSYIPPISNNTHAYYSIYLFRIYHFIPCLLGCSIVYNEEKNSFILLPSEIS